MSSFKDPKLQQMFGSILAAMETDFMSQGMSDKKAKILVGSLLLTVGQSALIQAAQMPSIVAANNLPTTKQ